MSVERPVENKILIKEMKKTLLRELIQMKTKFRVSFREQKVIGLNYLSNLKSINVLLPEEPKKLKEIESDAFN